MRAEQAGSGAKGMCPWTRLPVKACVGEILQYWAYEGGAPALPPGYEPETEWHACWKWPIRDEHCEVIFGANQEHRADIVGTNRTVIEIQHSRIDIRDVRDRVAFYQDATQQRVVWVVDISRFWRKTFRLGERDPKTGFYRVEWDRRHDWIYYLAQTRDTHLFLEYRYNDEKMFHAWVNRGVLWVNFQLKLSFFARFLADVAKPDFHTNPAMFLAQFERFRLAS